MANQCVTGTALAVLVAKTGQAMAHALLHNSVTVTSAEF